MDHRHRPVINFRTILWQGLHYAARTVAGREAGTWQSGDDPMDTPASRPLEAAKAAASTPVDLPQTGVRQRSLAAGSGRRA